MRSGVTALVRIGAAAGLCLLSALSASASDDRLKWWQSQEGRMELGLTADQSRELESIFQATLPAMRTDKDEIERQEQVLSRLMNEARISEAEIGQAVDRVEATRARASKTRLLMLYRMYRVLTPDQRQKLKGLHQRLREKRRGSSGNGNVTRQP
jgi:Spy/CpxP family protein refolding chaperone